MFEKQIQELKNKGYTELGRNDNSVYLMNKEIKYGVILMTGFSFESQETNNTITLFEQFKDKEMFLPKKTLCFIDKIKIEDKAEGESVEEFEKRIYNDQYFFLKLPMDLLNIVPYKKYDINIDFIDMTDENYIHGYPDINNEVFEISPFEVVEGIMISNYLNFLYLNKNKNKLYIACPPSLRDNAYYMKYLAESLITGDIKYTWA